MGGIDVLSEDQGNLQRAVEKHADAKRGTESDGFFFAATGGIELDSIVVINKIELFCPFRPLIMPKLGAEDKPGACRGPDTFFCNRALFSGHLERDSVGWEST
jgi:hypothetical protein